MGKFVNPFTDIGFKIIFGQPASKPFLITLLNELLAGEHRIEDLMFLDKEDHAEHVRDKGIIYDLYCRTSTGEYIIVEMQNRKHLNFVDRTLYYMCRAVSRQIEAPLAVEVHSPDDGEEGLEVREPSAPTTRHTPPHPPDDPNFIRKTFLCVKEYGTLDSNAGCLERTGVRSSISFGRRGESFSGESSRL
mgnify:CR=1 FL=1